MDFELATRGADVNGVDVRIGDLPVVIDGVEVVIPREDPDLRLRGELADDDVENAGAPVERSPFGDDAAEGGKLADSLVAGQAALALGGSLQGVALGPSNQVVGILHAHPCPAILEHDELLTLFFGGHDRRLRVRFGAQAQVQRDDRERLGLGALRRVPPPAVDDDQRQQREENHSQNDDHHEPTRVACGLSAGRGSRRRLRIARDHVQFRFRSFINVTMMAFCTCSRFSASS